MKGLAEQRAIKPLKDGLDTTSTSTLLKPALRDPKALERRIRAHLLSGALSVTLTDNRYTMISVRRDKKERDHYAVRLHHMFLGAGPRITKALAHYIVKNDRHASRLLGEYIDNNQGDIKPGPERKRRLRLSHRGSCFDLLEIFNALNEVYFDNKIVAKITWGQRSTKRRRRNSMKMGSYALDDKLIRIHRSLDRAFVPRFFIEWVVYHEMLHEVHQAPVVNGRRQFHSSAFLRDEAKYEYYDLAKAWERAHIDDLLTF